MRNLIAISAPSGTGKTTICRALQKRNQDIRFSVSYTTRTRRPAEIDGSDYHFISVAAFEQKISKDELAEYEEVHGDYYGTPKSTLEDTIQANQLLLLEVDVRGAMSIKRHYPDETMTFFLMPPSPDDLRVRLQNRGTDSPERIQKRLARLELELGYKEQFDFHIINDDVDRATSEIITIIERETKGVPHGN